MGDSISRQAALDEIQPFGEYESNRTNKEWVRLFTIVLKQLPSTDRKGHWIQKDYYETDWNVYECDRCGEPWQLECGTPKDNNMNYCPRCGADMRGGDDESTI